MFKTIIAATLTIFSSAVFAGAKPGDVNDSNTGIVTPDVATGFIVFEHYTYRTDGVMVVCKAPAERERGGKCEYQGKTAWTEIQNSVPANRKYVGFRVVSGAYGYRQIEVYFK